MLPTTTTARTWARPPFARLRDTRAYYRSTEESEERIGGSASRCRSRQAAPVFAGDDVLAQLDAFVADVDRRTVDEPRDVGLRFAAERAMPVVGRLLLGGHVVVFGRRL